jgi:hypothetical protein
MQTGGISLPQITEGTKGQCKTSTTQTSAQQVGTFRKPKQPHKKCKNQTDD